MQLLQLLQETGVRSHVLLRLLRLLQEIDARCRFDIAAVLLQLL